MRKQSLKVKITVLVVGSILGSTMILGALWAWHYAHDEKIRLERSLSQELEIVSFAASTGLEFNDPKTVEDAVVLLKNIKEFVDIKVLGVDGKIFAHKQYHPYDRSSGNDFFKV